MNISAKECISDMHNKLKCTKMNTELKGLCKFVLFPVVFLYIPLRFSSKVRKSSQYYWLVSHGALISLLLGFQHRISISLVVSNRKIATVQCLLYLNSSMTSD